MRARWNFSLFSLFLPVFPVFPVFPCFSVGQWENGWCQVKPSSLFWEFSCKFYNGPPPKNISIFRYTLHSIVLTWEWFFLSFSAVFRLNIFRNQWDFEVYQFNIIFCHRLHPQRFRALWHQFNQYLLNLNGLNHLFCFQHNTLLILSTFLSAEILSH